jgi:hypothetical protein
MNENVRSVVDAAKGWNHKSIRVVSGCPGETCAFFVRHVFKEALHNAGRMPVANFRPYYRDHGIGQLPTGETFADGLAGDEIGRKIPSDQMMPGDLLFFRDTYNDGTFPVGSITHVGICVASGGQMADSSGGWCSVRNYKDTFPGLLVEVRRPRCVETPVNKTGTGITLSDGQVRARMNGAQGNLQEIKIQLGHGSPMNFNVAGHQFSSNPTVLHVLVNGKPAPFFKFVTADITLAGQQNHVKLFYHDGITKAYIHGQETKNLEITARLGGGLHVWVNGKEIKPSAVNIGIS